MIVISIIFIGIILGLTYSTTPLIALLFVAIIIQELKLAWLKSKLMEMNTYGE